MGYTIKQGATFAVAVKFTDEEWSRIYPWTSVTSSVRQGSRVFPLTVAIDAAAKSLTLSATSSNTSLMAVGVDAILDLWVDRGGVKIPIPSKQNITMSVVRGATQ